METSMDKVLEELETNSLEETSDEDFSKMEASMDKVLEELETNSLEETSDQDFYKVDFQSVLASYPENVAVECQFQVSEAYEPTSGDWVGLFLVGWKLIQDYFCYMWAPKPGEDRRGKIVFPVGRLPPADGEFYQFLYVTSGQEVLGISVPFQFQKPTVDDFVEESEESDEDLMVIYSKKDFLQKELDCALAKGDFMDQHNKDLKKALGLAKAAQQLIKNKLEAALTANEEAEQINEELEDSNCELRKEIEGLNMGLEELKEKLQKAEAERDDLKKSNQFLSDQYQTEVISKGTKIEILERTASSVLEQGDEEKERLNEEIQSLRAANADLEEKLKNTQNLYEAMACNKELLQREMASYQETHAQISSQLEMTASHNYALNKENKSLRLQLACTDENLTQCQAKRNLLQASLEQVLEERKTLEEEKTTLIQRMRELNISHADLEQRLVLGKEAYLTLGQRLQIKSHALKSMQKRCYLPENFKIRRSSHEETAPGCLKVVLVGTIEEDESGATAPDAMLKVRAQGEPGRLAANSHQQVEEAQPQDLPRPLSPVPAPRTQPSEAAMITRHAAAAEPEEERFEDARGEAMQVCLECGAIFGPEQDVAYIEHVVRHVGEICPHCKAMKDDSLSTQQFQQHVRYCPSNPDLDIEQVD